MESADIAAVWITLKLASLVTLLLLVFGTPAARLLASTRSAMKGVVGVIVALPAAPAADCSWLLLARRHGPARTDRPTDQIAWHWSVAVSFLLAAFDTPVSHPNQ